MKPQLSGQKSRRSEVAEVAVADDAPTKGDRAPLRETGPQTDQMEPQLPWQK